MKFASHQDQSQAESLLRFSVQLYICDDNRRANEYDFKKALDLLEYITEVTSWQQQSASLSFHSAD